MGKGDVHVRSERDVDALSAEFLTHGGSPRTNELAVEGRGGVDASGWV